VRITLSSWLGTGCACLALAGAARAQTLYVNASAPAGGNGASWASAFRDLQSALVVAGPGNQVWVARGRYQPSAANPAASFVLPDGVPVYGGFAGTETSLAQRDPAANVTVLDGDLLGDDLPGFVNYADNAQHVVRAAGTLSAFLDGFTVRGGSVGPGAGIRLEVQRATLANLVVRENSAKSGNPEGGGVGLLCPEVRVSDCLFADNRATGGGGMLMREPQDALVERCTFERNAATGGANLEITGIAVGVVTLSGDQFRDASATGGAGVSVAGEGLELLQLEGCTFERLHATTGGALCVNAEHPDALSIVACVFRDNDAGTGGAVAVITQFPIQGVLADCRFEDGAACAGAGLYVHGATLELTRCTFARNHLQQGCGLGTGGGAIRAELGTDRVTLVDSSLASSDMALVWAERGADLELERCTLFNDVSSPAIRLVGRSTLVLTNSIVWGLDAQQLQADALATVDARYSDVRTGGAPLAGVGNLAQDPQFVGAASLDLRLGAASPCVEAGDPSSFPLGPDIDRDSRVLDGDRDGVLRLDMGANELAVLHLEVLGTPAVGQTLTFVTTGTPGLAATMLLGRAGLRFVPNVGTLFLSGSGLVRSAWPTTPSTVQVLVPPGVFGPFHAQAVGLGGGAPALTNFVALPFP